MSCGLPKYTSSESCESMQYQSIVGRNGNDQAETQHIVIMC